MEEVKAEIGRQDKKRGGDLSGQGAGTQGRYGGERGNGNIKTKRMELVLDKLEKLEKERRTEVVKVRPKTG